MSCWLDSCLLSLNIFNSRRYLVNSLSFLFIFTSVLGTPLSAADEFIVWTASLAPPPEWFGWISMSAAQTCCMRSFAPAQYFYSNRLVCRRAKTCDSTASPIAQLKLSLQLPDLLTRFCASHREWWHYSNSSVEHSRRQPTHVADGCAPRPTLSSGSLVGNFKPGVCVSGGSGQQVTETRLVRDNKYASLFYVRGREGKERGEEEWGRVNNVAEGARAWEGPSRYWILPNDRRQKLSNSGSMRDILSLLPLMTPVLTLLLQQLLSWPGSHGQPSRSYSSWHLVSVRSFLKIITNIQYKFVF